MVTVELRIYSGWDEIGAAVRRHPDTIRKNWKKMGLHITFPGGKPTLTSIDLYKWTQGQHKQRPMQHPPKKHP